MIQREGPGWRLERDELRTGFPVLIGGENWAVELSSNEWQSLNGVILDLIGQYEQLKSQLMPEEKVFLEIERLPWWACIDGNSENWSLKLILSAEGTDKRGLEVFWPIPVAQVIVSAMRTMWDSQ
ncbi:MULTISPECIES: DUF1818 family protein [unclassified Prochlorococcus]|uniref:DUF1818 family protein n=1 Tax=unclassified Prochlorococcus TaxID=2627481 RepID=UPI000533B56F|nr:MULTISPECIES: DUF1818 family protein [unclassified Prochlorococcus]KGG14811.1 hypothetical protein EV06_1874 [Prochlorococcus sp. MIT 0602]KGG15756.1 hypothetical protein EV07_1721 [Prochlorococcus sp. MIT 0603]